MLKIITKNIRPRHSLYECSCGAIKEIRTDSVKSGATVSCGCFRAKKAKSQTHSTKHGLHKSKTYGIWCSMKQRCRNPNNKFFPYYGGRGIDYCERWEKFENFLADMGERPDGLTIERIKNSLGYSPENCKWATRTEQQRNRRACVYVEHHGERKTLMEWSEKLGIPHQTLSQRVLLGWPPEKVLSTEHQRDISGLALGGKISGEIRAAKTHCKWGHEFTPENTAPNGKNGRTCRRCHADRQLARKRKHQAPTFEPKT